jgi:hypothetical protein
VRSVNDVAVVCCCRGETGQATAHILAILPEKAAVALAKKMNALNKAAVDGDFEALRTLLQEDRKIVWKVDNYQVVSLPFAHDQSELEKRIKNST